VNACRWAQEDSCSTALPQSPRPLPFGAVQPFLGVRCVRTPKNLCGALCSAAALCGSPPLPKIAPTSQSLLACSEWSRHRAEPWRHSSCPTLIGSTWTSQTGQHTPGRPPPPAKGGQQCVGVNAQVLRPCCPIQRSVSLAVPQQPAADCGVSSAREDRRACTLKSPA